MILGVNRRVVNDQQQEAIRLMCDMRAAGATYVAIVKELERRRIPAAMGGHYWSGGVVARLIERGPHTGPRIVGVTRTEIQAIEAARGEAQDSGVSGELWRAS